MRLNRRILLTNCELSSKTRLALLEALGPEFVIRNVNGVQENEIGQVEIMLFDTVKSSDKEWLTGDKIGRMQMLKLIQSIRAGVDALDFGNIPPKVIVCGNVGAYSESMAEFAMGMILYLAKDLGNRNSKLRLGIPDYENSILLRGKRIGIIGAGGIGQAIARIAKCFGMTTIGVNTSGKPAKSCDLTFAITELNRVLTFSDVIVLALPLTVKTFHIIDRRELSLMKKDCILVNLGRGDVINEKALYYHLRKNPLFKCGLDVWWHYPKSG
nr:hypothetical protein [Nitrososphaerota archaeon]